MGEELGIKETKEAFIGINELGLFLVERLKDGVGLDDAMAAFQKLTSDDEFKAVMSAAIDGISQVKAEVKDLSIAEGMEIATMSIGYLPKWVEAFKKETA